MPSQTPTTAPRTTAPRTTRPALGTHRSCGQWSCPGTSHRHSAPTLWGTLWFTCRGR